MTKVIWTDTRWQRAKRLRRDDATDVEIAAAIGLTERQVQNRFANERWRQRAVERTSRMEVDFRDRNAREAAANRRTLTQQFFGDPPPGYSALDRKRAAVPTRGE